MKKRAIVVGLLCGACLSQPGRTAAQSLPGLTVVERGPHHRVWSRGAMVADADGRGRRVTNEFVEIQTGLHYVHEGRWLQTREEFRLTQQGAVAQFGPHQVILAADLALPGAVDVLTPAGQRLRSNPRWLAYYEPASGRNILLAQVKPCRPSRVAPNVILYEDAFDTIRGAVRYTYTRSGLEQDVVLYESPGRPEDYGLDPLSTRLEVATEMLEAPAPRRLRRALGPAQTDEALDFGAWQIRAGHAFAARGDGPPIPVGKTWERLAGREFLTESIDYRAVVPLLESLPASPQARAAARGVPLDPPGLPRRSFSQKAELARAVLAAAPAHLLALNPPATPVSSEVETTSNAGTPNSPPAQPASTSASFLAAAPPASASGPPALVIDYVAVAHSPQVFRGDTTYLVSGPVNLSGEVIFEPGTVVKFAPDANAGITILQGSAVQCLGEPFRLVHFTAKEDCSVGETIVATGDPSKAYSAVAALVFEEAASEVGWARFAHAALAVRYLTPGDYRLRHCQFVHCQTAVASAGGTVTVENALVYQVPTVVEAGAGGVGLVWEQVTVDQSARLVAATSAGTSLQARHCLFASLAGLAAPAPVALSGEWNGFYAAPVFAAATAVTASTDPFAVAQGGRHYLAPGSAFRQAGAAAISPQLKQDLAGLTVDAPALVTVRPPPGTVLAPRVVPDAAGRDLGYHYPPVDYVLSGATLENGRLTLTNGVCVAASGRAGLTLGNGARWVCEGSPRQPNRLVRLATVQESPAAGGSTPFLEIAACHATRPQADLRFTEVLPAAGTRASASGNALLQTQPHWLERLALRDCEVSMACLWLYPASPSPGGMSTTLSLVNNVLLGCDLALWKYYYGQNDRIHLTLQNNLLQRCAMAFTYALSSLPYGNPTWEIHDNLFDRCSLQHDVTPYIARSHNGYAGCLPPLGGTDERTGLTPDFAEGPLGAYYYPPASPNASSLASLVDADPVRQASWAGLCPYTTAIEAATREGTSPLDIGFHHVAVDATGQPMDSDADGLPDYLEDRNGNGVTDPGETNALSPDTDGDGVPDGWEAEHGLDPLNAADAEADPDQDGYANWEEHSLGLGPQVPDPPRAIVSVVADALPTVSEGSAGTRTFQVRRQGDGERALEVYFDTVGTAASGMDFRPLGQSVVIPAGQFFALVPLVLIDDSDDERDETVTLRLMPDLGYTLAAPPEDTALMTIQDDDLPTVSLRVTDATATEPQNGVTDAGEFEVTRTGVLDGPLTVALKWTGTAGRGTDYTDPGATLTLAAGAAKATVAVRPNADTSYEGVETVSLSLAAGAGYRIAVAVPENPVEINDKTVPKVWVTPGTPLFKESAPNGGYFLVETDTAVQKDLVVNYRLWGDLPPQSGGCTRVSPGFKVSSTYAVIAAGQKSARITIFPGDDDAAQTVRKVNFTLIPSLGYALDRSQGRLPTAAVLIDDDEPTQHAVQVLRQCVGLYQVTGGVPGEIEVQRTGSVVNQLRVPFTVTACDATGQSLPATAGNLTGDLDVTSSSVFWKEKQSLARLKFERRSTAVAWFFFSFLGQNYRVYCFGPEKAFYLAPYSDDEASEDSPTGNGKFLICRKVNGPAMTLRVKYAGTAQPDFDFTTPKEFDVENMPNEMNVYFPANVSKVEVPVFAIPDTQLEGWEYVVFRLLPNPLVWTTINLNADATKPPDSCAVVWLRDMGDASPIFSRPLLDLDLDTLPDAFETQFGLNPLAWDNPDADADGDALGWFDEFFHGTNPTRPDTDGDGSEDALEIIGGTDPIVKDAPLKPEESVAALLNVSRVMRGSGSTCYSCHPLRLHVGTQQLTSLGECATAQALRHFKKGQTYPIRLLEVVTGDSPPRARTYSAHLTPPDNNPPGWYVDDPQGLLGDRLLYTSAIFNKIAALVVPDLRLAVDANRDGVIAFDDADQTSRERPFRFWLNDDLDEGSDDQAADHESGVAGRNCDNDCLDGQRDLEDLTRLHLRLKGATVAQLASGAASLSLHLENIDGQPEFKIFGSCETDGGLRYLTDLSTAEEQAGRYKNQRLGTVSSAYECSLPLTWWSNNPDRSLSLFLLFEGSKEGVGKIRLRLRKKGQLAAESQPVWLELRPVRRFYEHFTVGDTTDLRWDRIPHAYTRVSADYLPVNPRETDDYILFVHGWRVEPWERRAFAETAFKRLYWVGFKGRFGLFSWPTEWISDNVIDPRDGTPMAVDLRHFDRCERKAWVSGRGLAALLRDLDTQHPGKVSLFAHSLGNVTACEALRFITDTDARQVLRTYAACQAAMAAHLFDASAPRQPLTVLGVNADSGTYNLYAEYWRLDTSPPSSAPYLYALQGAEKMVNLYNPRDHALGNWLMNQAAKPDLNYGFDPRGGFFYGTTMPHDTVKYYPKRWLTPPKDRYEIFAYAAEARSLALGAQAGVRGVFAKTGVCQEIDLQARCGFGANEWHHSAQFLSTCARRWSFWTLLIKEFAIASE